MLRASLGAADCGRRLSIANEEGVQSQRNRPECATGSGLERTREGWMHRPTPGALYHILYSLSFFFKKYNIVIIQISRKMQIPPSSRRHILCNPPSTQSETNLDSPQGLELIIPFLDGVTSRSQLS
jgi:hypothetical protein